MNIRKLLPIAMLAASLSAFPQQRFHGSLPAGNYSGICPLGDGRFALVDDKASTDGFYLFRLGIDTLACRITKAENLGYQSSRQPNRDMEGICYRPSTQTFFISGEADNQVLEYTLDGELTGRRLNMPQCFSQTIRNLGLEALCYDSLQHLFYTTTERPLPGDSLLRLQTFGDDLQPARQLFYRPDAPISRKYYYGVSALCALPDGRLIVLERQIRVPRLKLGAKTVVRLYEVRPAGAADGTLLAKRLLHQFTTRLTLTGRRFANYEGLCALSPRHLLLVADSQNRYRGILRDWFMLLRL